MSLEVDQLSPNFAVANLDDQPALHRKHALSNAGCHTSTAAARFHAVERVILFMREQFGEPISLHDMAEIAGFSPYHFNRIFRSITGISPCRFLTALRLETAKRLLLSTPASVTEVCFDVGYNSLGTFTTHFTQTIGLPPRRLRCLAQDTHVSCREVLHSHHTDRCSCSPLHHSVTGKITAPEASAQLIFVGLFPTPIPQSRPVSCALLTAPGAYHLPSVPDGHYYVFGAAFACSEDPLAYLLPDVALLQVGVGQNPLLVQSGQVSGHADMTLRPVQLIDPPILIALPFLLTERLNSHSVVTA